MNKRGFFFILIAVFVTATFFIGYRLMERLQRGSSVVTNLPSLTLWDINYVKNVRGRPVWSLQVDSATKDESTGVMKADMINLIIFNDGRPAIHLRADKGDANVKKGLFHVWGRVEVQDEKSRCILHAKNVEFDEKKRIVWSDQDVALSCQDLNLKGKGFVLQLKEGVLRVNGPVVSVLD